MAWLSADDCWLLRLVLAFLDPHDATCLVLFALETRNERLAQLLLRGDAYPFSIDERCCLDVAAGSWRAVLTLLKPLNHPKRRAKKLPPARDRVDRVFAQVEAVARLIRFELSPNVMYEAAARGDLAVVKWVHTKTTYDAAEACTRAAKARNVEVVQWLVDRTSGFEVALRLEDSGDLRAVCWTDATRVSNSRHHLTAVELFGHYLDYTPAHVATPPEFSLAMPFAERGDVARLQQILALPSGLQYFSEETINRAAAHRQLEVVQWLQPLRQWRWNVALSRAVNGGHLETVKWIFPYTAPHSSYILEHAVTEGQVDIVRWYISQGALEWNKSLHILWRGALRSCSVEMLKLVKDEIGVKLHEDQVYGKANLASIKYLAEHVLPSLKKPQNSAELLLRCVSEQGTLEAMMYIIQELGCRHPSLFAWAVKPNAKPLLAFLYEDAKIRAANDGSRVEDLLHFPILQLLLNGSDDIPIWMWEKIPEYDSEEVSCAKALDPDRLRLTDYRHVGYCNWYYRLIGVVLCWLRFRPHQCGSIEWLPECAIRASSTEAFERLEAINHPQLFTAKTRDVVLTHSRCAYFMMRLLSHDWSLLSSRVVCWATKYGHLSLLGMISERLADEMSRVQKRHQVIGLAVRSAAMHGRTKVLQWVREEGCKTLDISEEACFHNLARIVIHHGHVDVLKWLHQHGLLGGCKTSLLVAQAARYGRLRCLQWIIETFAVQDSAVLTKRVRAAVERGHINVVQHLLLNAGMVDLSRSDSVKVNALVLQIEQ